jgi:outer membrane receptor protein involved in Fe transport
LRYRPVDDVEFRGNYTESIRAPSITELFTPKSTIFAFANDPCDERYIGQGNVPAVRSANCAADGIVQPFQSFIVNASQQVSLSGNPDLNSEIAESYTYGVILRPRFLEGLTASFDWFDIEITNAIESLTATDILRACYDSSAFPNEPACSLFDRDAEGQIADVRTGFVNVGLVEFAGLQSVLSYGLSLGNLGDLDFSVSHLYSEQHLETPGSGNTLRLDGQVGESKNRVTATVTWSKNDWTVFNQIRYLSSVVFNNADEENTRNVPGLPSWTTFDTSVNYALNDNVDLQLNIDNLFNRKAPYASIASAFGETTYFSGILERYATFTVRARF